MPAENVRLHPHIFESNVAAERPFRSPLSGRGKALSLQQRDRAAHAEALLEKLRAIEPVAERIAEEQEAQGIDGGHGIYLQFESEPGFDLKFESLDFSRSGIELCAVRRAPDNLTQATVFVPDGKLAFFLKRIEAYRDENTAPNQDGETRPKNEDLVASVSDIRIAALEAMWTDPPELFPNPATTATWEVWLRRGGKLDHLQRLRNHAAGFNLTVREEVLTFVDRSIVLVYGKGEDLARSIEILGAIAELRLAKTSADFFTAMTVVEQQAWMNNLADRVEWPSDQVPYICLLDTGVNAAHPLIRPVIGDNDQHTYKPAWGKDDRKGHGTPMAGLAVFGDLVHPLGDPSPVKIGHKLESVKMVNDADPHEPQLYGAVTTESANRVEVTPNRRRIYCMALTTPDNRDRGRPSSWSAAIDDLTSGRIDGQRRIVVISAGNTDTAYRHLYADSNFTDSVHDPAQSWNALTVGGYTEKALVDQTRFPGWQPVAISGDLAPASCTSITWKRTKWPIKPDVVMEAGNMARHPDHGEPDYIDDALQLLSTAHNFTARAPFITFGDTSASTALTARLAAILWAKYPDLTPEAIRALIVHSAAWTPAMMKRFTAVDGIVDYDSLVRCFGYGVPNVRQLLSSADNSLTLIAQGRIRPFEKDGSGVKAREMKLHALPWPVETLQELQDTPVTLRVTLSYFIEPNPGDRGWTTKYGYQSHGLRFAVKRANENIRQFEQRINKAVRDEEYDGNNFEETGEWMFKGNDPLVALGSVRSNIWQGLAADLAARGHIGVYPTYGWWNKRPNLKGYEKTSHYALVATITTPETDIYTPVATQIGIPVIIET